jgi:hypothetical protein
MPTRTRTSVLCIAFMLAACGPSVRDGGDDMTGPCDPGDTRTCYSGQDGTKGVGPCKEGKTTCDASGVWGACGGEVVPTGENCADGVDNNCNGAIDEDEDKDGDGITTCAGDCCDSTECSDPKLVNAGAFDAPGNLVDDDCDGAIDNTALLCDQGLVSNSTAPIDYAKAMDLCQTTTMTDKKWGVISATLTLADGAGAPDTKSHAIRTKFGTNVLPKGGTSMAVLSTGAAAGKGDTNPGYQSFQDTPAPGNNKQSAFPADFVMANGNKLPNAPGCPQPSGANARDPVMLTLTIRVPTNAKSFKLDTNFFSSEFPEYTCSPFNDFFVVLLDSMYAGSPANPTDKNLAFYAPAGSTMKYPVGVNLASGNTGLFTQCVNGRVGCAQLGNGTITTCTSTTDLAGTGFDNADPGTCDANSLEGGGTGWLQTSGNVMPGEIIKLRIAIWDTSDHVLDSLALVDAFTWSVDLSQPGTVIF